MARMRRLFRRVSRRGYPAAQLLSVYRDLGVIPKSSREDNFNRPSEDLSSYQLVRPGDLVVNKMKAWQGSVAISCYDGIVSPAYFVFVSTSPNHRRFLHYLLRSKPYIAQYAARSKGIRPSQWDLDIDAFNDISVLLPTPETQCAIADFLDRETAKADAIVAKYERLIELLEEKRVALITQAVTKGLDPNVPMKDSGIEWMGAIPAHWSVVLLKSLFFFAKGRNAQILTSEYLSNHKGEYPVYSGQTENNGVMGLVDTYQYDKSSVLFTTTVGARVMTPMRLSGKFSLSQNCMVGMPRQSSKTVDFVYYQLFPLFEYEKASIPSYMQPSLRVSDMNSYRVAIPPIQEMGRISRYLDMEQLKCSSLVEKLLQAISLVTEHRSALITAAVTGQIDVRTYKAKAQAEVVA